MADEHKKEEGHNPMSDVKFLVVGFVLLLILWWANGGPQRADLRGIFLQPPSPVGSGAAYGPQFGQNPTTSVPQAQGVSYGYRGSQ